MKRRHVATGTVALTTAIAMAGAGATMAHAAGNDNNRVRLSNSGTPRTMNGQSVTFQSAARSSRAMSLTLQLPQRNEAQLEALLAKGQVISPAQYRARFGATKGQLRKVSKWAEGQGMTVTGTSAASAQVTVTGNVSKVNKAFGVQVRNARLGSTSGVAVRSAPSVPADLGVTGVSGLSTLHRMQKESVQRHGGNKLSLPKASAKSNRSTAIRRSGSLTRSAKAAASDGSGDCSQYWGQHLLASAAKYSQESNAMCGYTPKQLVTMYGAGKAQSQSPTIGVLLWDNDTKMKSTANHFFKKAGYPQLTKYTAVADKSTGACGTPDYGEQAIDVEMSHVIAPKSPVIYYGAADCQDSSLTKMFQKAVDAHKVSTLSMSFGNTSDAGMTSADIAAWQRPMQQASATGISVFASSGDWGTNKTKSGKVGVGTPAAFPLVTAVGGTSVGLDKAGKQPVLAGWETRVFSQADPTKASWKDVTFDSSELPIAGAGGGVSQTFAQPAWQKGKVRGSTTKRVVPDVSALADPYTGVALEYTDNGAATGGTFGGTSVASPLLAAQVALAKARNHLTLGNAAKTFYKLAGTSALKDVNSPNKAGVFWQLSNGGLGVFAIDAKPESLVTAKGWDNVTGVGTPSGAAFYSAFK